MATAHYLPTSYVYHLNESLQLSHETSVTNDSFL